jgi:hypothetical protein
MSDEALKARVSEAVRDVTKLRGDVHLVAQGSLANDGKVIEIGDVIDLEQHMDKKIPFIPNLRKWDGKIFQLVSKLEMHRKEYVRFTVVLMWDGNKFVAVDKF